MKAPTLKRIKKRISHFVRSIHYRMTAPKPAIHHALKLLQNIQTDVFFVQIGAFDGTTGDPVCSFASLSSWRGVVVEPMEEHFLKLARHYASSKGVQCENSAIASETGISKFYYVDDPKGEMVDFVNQISSLKKDVLLKHVPPSDLSLLDTSAEKDKPPIIQGLTAASVKERLVKTMTFSDLLTKYSVKSIDALLIDTEGYDYEVVKQINFSKIKPKIIWYEHWHLGDDVVKCREYLESVGYQCRAYDQDTLAVLKGIPLFDEITKKGLLEVA